MFFHKNFMKIENKTTEIILNYRSLGQLFEYSKENRDYMKILRAEYDASSDIENPMFHLDLSFEYDASSRECVEKLSDLMKILKEENINFKDREFILNSSYESLNLSARAEHACMRAEIKTVRDLTNRSEADLMNLRYCGKTTTKEIKEKLSKFGLGLKDLENFCAHT